MTYCNYCKNENCGYEYMQQQSDLQKAIIHLSRVIGFTNQPTDDQRTLASTYITALEQENGARYVRSLQDEIKELRRVLKETQREKNKHDITHRIHNNVCLDCKTI